MKSLLWCRARLRPWCLLVRCRRSADSLLYGFESADSPNSLDGFAANGGGITVTSSTIGATQNAAHGRERVDRIDEERVGRRRNLHRHIDEQHTGGTE